MIDKLNIEKKLNAIAEIPKEEINKFLDISRKQKILKGTNFILQGETASRFALVLKGLFRYYYIDRRGSQFTKGFFAEGSIISSYSALINNRESYFTIEALENSSIISVNYQEWKSIYEKKICWHKFLIALLEKGYCMKEAREREFLLMNAEERYRTFMKNFTGLEKRIKQNIIASYLGITPVALSRIRKKMDAVNLG